jgi:hypothetical protein
MLDNTSRCLFFHCHNSCLLNTEAYVWLTVSCRGVFSCCSLLTFILYCLFFYSSTLWYSFFEGRCEYDYIPEYKAVTEIIANFPYVVFVEIRTVSLVLMLLIKDSMTSSTCCVLFLHKNDKPSNDSRTAHVAKLLWRQAQFSKKSNADFCLQILRVTCIR